MKEDLNKRFLSNRENSSIPISYIEVLSALGVSGLASFPKQNGIKKKVTEESNEVVDKFGNHFLI